MSLTELKRRRYVHHQLNLILKTWMMHLSHLSLLREKGVGESYFLNDHDLYFEGRLGDRVEILFYEI
ncbi:hypothetical protein AQUCO_00700759v1 [Aquilegia coerulea]|uniref:PORR domain-containing protein n=1 Tax=Aquilegia coerulea TaxID=218851 RepID=A0A2G5ELK1_AQUCA|nr:hypothetical protein AQUCO_00700759v1 [Aquilegia coerulea]